MARRSTEFLLDLNDHGYVKRGGGVGDRQGAAVFFGGCRDGGQDGDLAGRFGGKGISEERDHHAGEALETIYRSWEFFISMVRLK